MNQIKTRIFNKLLKQGNNNQEVNQHHINPISSPKVILKIN
jgi:hypothetical protein